MNDSPCFRYIQQYKSNAGAEYPELGFDGSAVGLQKGRRIVKAC